LQEFPWRRATPSTSHSAGRIFSFRSEFLQFLQIFASQLETSGSFSRLKIMKNPETLSLCLALGSVAFLGLIVTLIFGLICSKRQKSPPHADDQPPAPEEENRLPCVLPPRRDPTISRTGQGIQNRKSNSGTMPAVHPPSAFWINARARRPVRR
jgi:hypothetical protein